VWLRNFFFNHLFVNLFNPFFFVSFSSLQHGRQLNKIQCLCMTIINYLVGVRAYLRTYGNDFSTVIFQWSGHLRMFSLSVSLSLVIKSIVDFSSLAIWSIKFIRLEKKLIMISRLSTGTELSEREKFVFFSLLFLLVYVLVDII
jgi:hypothetical protein